MMIVLTDRQLLEFALCHVRLQRVLHEIGKDWPSRFMYLSRIWSTEDENEAAGARTLIHTVGPPYRAADVSGKNLTGGVDERWELCGAIAKRVNRRWAYDPNRPGRFSVAYAKPHGSGPHIHLQVHPNTRRR